jgi:hypothetical protein
MVTTTKEITVPNDKAEDKYASSWALLIFDVRFVSLLYSDEDEIWVVAETVNHATKQSNANVAKKKTYDKVEMNSNVSIAKKIPMKTRSITANQPTTETQTRLLFAPFKSSPEGSSVEARLAYTNDAIRMQITANKIKVIIYL